MTDVPDSARVFRSVLLLAEVDLEATLGIGVENSSQLVSGSAQLDPDRATFAKTDANFDPTPHLGVFTAATYLEPDLLHRRRLPGGLPASVGSAARHAGRLDQLLPPVG